MRRLLLILFGVLTYNIISAQVTITTDTTSDKFKIQESTYITDMPLGSVYVDVNSSGNIGLKILGTDKLIVGYKTPATYTINGVLQSNKDTCVKYLSLATSLKLEYLISNISSGGGGTTYFAKNGIYIDSDTIKLGGNITEDTKLDNPNSKSIQIGSDGDAMNLNVVPPIEFNEFLASFSGFDYQDEHMKTVFGIIKDIVFQDFGFDSTTMVGSFTIAGNPFDSISPDGSIFIDGIFYDSESDIVGQKKFIITFLGGDLTLTANEQSDLDQIINIVGNYANQSQVIQGDNATQDKIIIGNNATQYQAIQGENGLITRQVLDSTNGNYFIETITASKIVTEVDTIQIKAQILGFFDSIGISQPILPLGSSTDDVIQVLQNLGLVKEN